MLKNLAKAHFVQKRPIEDMRYHFESKKFYRHKNIKKRFDVRILSGAYYNEIQIYLPSKFASQQLTYLLLKVDKHLIASK